LNYILVWKSFIMPDLLVKLYELPALEPILAPLRARNIEIRRALAPEKHLVTEWVRAKFSAHWASECEVAFAHQPIGCFIAVQDARCIGFACHDATCRGFFGPEGVASEFRGAGIGKGLLLSCLHDMEAQGYAYAIIGVRWANEFYSRVVARQLSKGRLLEFIRACGRCAPASHFIIRKGARSMSGASLLRLSLKHQVRDIAPTLGHCGRPGPAR
jgi:GNAT superfamily N-acetyltransferase